MDEPEDKEKSLPNDPRDYYEETLFWKMAQGISQNNRPEWQGSFHGRIYKDLHSKFAFADTRDENNNSVLLVAAENLGKIPLFETVVSTPATLALIQVVADDLLPRTQTDMRFDLVKRVLDIVKREDSELDKALKICGVYLDLLSQVADTHTFSSKDEFLDKLISLVPESKRNQLQDNITDQIQYNNDPWGISLASTIGSILVEFSNIHEIQFEEIRVDIRKETLEFDLQSRVGNSIKSVDDLHDALKDIPHEVYPIKLKVEGKVEAEMVPLSQIVGGSGLISWDNPSISEGRGKSRVMNFVKAVVEGRSKYLFNEPIRLLKQGGSYFINDGRHRVAAFKALGIDQIPAIVIS